MLNYSVAELRVIILFVISKVTEFSLRNKINLAILYEMAGLMYERWCIQYISRNQSASGSLQLNHTLRKRRPNIIHIITGIPKIVRNLEYGSSILFE